MTAKFAGACAHCGGAIAAGEKIEWSKQTGAMHAGDGCAAFDDGGEAKYFADRENIAEIRGFSRRLADGPRRGRRRPGRGLVLMAGQSRLYGESKTYKGQAIDTADGTEVWFTRKTLLLIETYETAVIAEALDGKQFNISIDEWEGGTR